MSAAGEDASRTPRRRLILLGASNLARGIATAVATAGVAWSEPIDLLAALGHGRSYGMNNWVLGRTLPGIATCQLWNDLDAREPLPTSAIVTDIGNDILYGVSPEKISAWVKKCFERLSTRGAAIATTGLPLVSLARMSPWEFRIFSSILYPFSFLKFQEAQARARELDAAMLGPNCMGVFAPGGPAAWNGRPQDTTTPGGVAVLCQSGSIADAFLSLGGRIGIRCVISSGAEVTSGRGASSPEPSFLNR